MAVAVVSSGTQTAVISTEHTLATVTSVKTLVLNVDTSAMLIGDILELRIKYKTLTGGASVLYKLQAYQHSQAAPQKMSDPIPSDIETVFTLKQVAGTGRAFPWKVISLD